MQSILITSGNLEKRKNLAIVKLSNYQIANLDTLIIEGNNAIGIDQIRELEQWVSRKPYVGKSKAAIINEAEKLTIEAQNALLKTLEEPPKNTLIILTAPNESSLLPTIVSRCKIIKLKSEAEIKLDKQTLKSMLHVTCYMLHARVGERLQKAAEIAKTREEVIVFLNQLTLLLRHILLAKATQSSPSPSSPFSQCSPLPQSHAAVSLCGKLTIRQIASVIKSLLKTKKMVEKNVNPKLVLENFFLDLPSLK